MQNNNIQSSPESYQIRVSGRLVGEVTNGTFTKKISGSRHILRKPPAIALSVESLQEAERVGARDIQITDIDLGCVYACTLQHFKSHAFSLQRGGFEPQLALPLELFDVSAPLEITSHAPKRGEVKRKPGNGQRVRNPRGVSFLNLRQLVFEGMA
jgi:hypothetical protein